MCSPWFPLRGPPVGSALPSPGSSEASSPASTVLWRCATPWVPHAALRCLRLALPDAVPVVSLPAVQGTQPRARGWSSGPRFRKKNAWRPAGPPKFLGSPPFLLVTQWSPDQVAAQYQVAQELLRRPLPASARVAENHFYENEPYQALIGRDVLEHCLFVYDGTNKVFSFAF